MLNFLLTSVVWNTNYENNPENSDGPNFGAAEMRSDRRAVRERLEKEHTMNLLSGVVANDGYHKPGSSKDYYQADAPTLRPDGVTALTADDNGRRWVRSTDNINHVYIHPNWVRLNAYSVSLDSPLHPGEGIKFKVFTATILNTFSTTSFAHGITNAATDNRILNIRAVLLGVNDRLDESSRTAGPDYRAIAYYTWDDTNVQVIAAAAGLERVYKFLVMYI